MQKIYIDKKTNMVMQIIQEDYNNFEKYDETTFGEELYLVEVDDEHHISDHNTAYIIDKKEFIRLNRNGDGDEACTVELSEVEKLKNKINDLEKIINDLVRRNEDEKYK